MSRVKGDTPLHTLLGCDAHSQCRPIDATAEPDDVLSAHDDMGGSQTLLVHMLQLTAFIWLPS